ncbi:MAG: MMPL family transporter [Gemmatimonadaceae bacterium]|nr:MMPL family transporter [Gloeobacterales cyanobacterium ES-bin-141]
MSGSAFNIDQSSVRLSIFVLMGRLAYRYRFWVVLTWGALLVLSLIFAPRLDTVLKGSGTADVEGPASRTERLLQRELNFTSTELVTAVFKAPPGQVLVSYQEQIDRVLEQVRVLPVVQTVTTDREQPQFLSRDGRTAYSLVRLGVSGNAVNPALDQIEALLKPLSATRVRAYLTGMPVVFRDAARVGKADLGRAELMALPLTLVVLLFVFGSVVASALPVAMGVVTVSATLGLLCLLTLSFDISVFALNVVTMVGLGLGIDYSLLMVNRFREELRSHTPEESVARTMDTAGRAVFFSGVIVCIGMASLLLFPILLLRSIAVAGSLTVLLSVVAALTLMPALLGYLGRGVDRWRVVPTAPVQGGFWALTARTVTRHSVVAVVAVLVLVAVLASPFLNARFALGDASILPMGVPSRDAADILKQDFGAGESTPILLAVSSIRAERVLSPGNVATLHELVAGLTRDPRVERVGSLFNASPLLGLTDYQELYAAPERIPYPELAEAVRALSTDRTTLLIVTAREASNAPESRALVEELRRLAPDGLEVQVGGQTASELDTIEVIYQRFPLVAGVIVVTTFVVLCVLLNSVVLPLKVLLINLLSIGASFGALVFIFQTGNFHTWLNFTPLGYLDILVPVVLFCVLFGLSMDYEVFLLTRIKEAYDQSGDNTQSVITGLERTGRIITSAALLMIIVTGAFALTNIIFVKALGLGIAIAVLIDATLIRAILVPASMHLLGKWNWWAPEFLGLDRFKVKLD